MLRALRVTTVKVKFLPAPILSIMQSTAENIKRSSSSIPTSATTTKSYAPQNLPVYDYDLVVIGGGSGGKT